LEFLLAGVLNEQKTKGILLIIIGRFSPWIAKRFFAAKETSIF
jgi:hypothetical protein